MMIDYGMIALPQMYQTNSPGMIALKDYRMIALKDYRMIALKDYRMIALKDYNTILLLNNAIMTGVIEPSYLLQCYHRRSS